MKSLILKSSTLFLLWVLVAFSLFLLIRGHNAPGGGFAGGLTGALGFLLAGLSYDVKHAEKLLFLKPQSWIAIGMLCAIFSGFYSWLHGKAFLTSIWFQSLGSPLLFDFGVYFIVLGVTTLIGLSLMEEQ